MSQIRRNQMLNYIRQKKTVTLKELSDKFPEVTEMTIRRDLNILQNENNLERTWGGAKYIDEVIETPFKHTNRAIKSLDKKRLIAAKAAQLLSVSTSIFLDSGTTMIELAKVLPQDISLFVVTNNPYVCMELLQHDNCDVFVTGGALDKSVVSFDGPSAIDAIDRVNIDIAFLGAAAVSPEHGFSNAQYGDCLIKQKIIKAASLKVMLIDSDKMNMLQPYSFCSFDKIDIIVSDKPLPEPIQVMADKSNVKIMLP